MSLSDLARKKIESGWPKGDPIPTPSTVERGASNSLGMTSSQSVCPHCGAAYSYTNLDHAPDDCPLLDLRNALHEIAEGCISRRPGHVDAGKNRTKAQIEKIARAALALHAKPEEPPVPAVTKGKPAG
jgi:hypothetical protein